MPCTTPPAIWPSTIIGLIITPQSSLTTKRRTVVRAGARVDLAVAMWQSSRRGTAAAVTRAVDLEARLHARRAAASGSR